MDKFDVSNDHLSFSAGEYGKPELVSPNIDIKFNYSHSGEWIVCAMSHEDIGVDVEKVQEIDISIADSFFSCLEKDHLMACQPNQRLDYFYDLWTLKESYIKWDGRGLSIPLKDFSIDIKSTGDIQIKSDIYRSSCFFKQYFIDGDYKLSVCSSKNEFPDQVTHVMLDDLCKVY